MFRNLDFRYQFQLKPLDTSLLTGLVRRHHKHCHKCTQTGVVLKTFCLTYYSFSNFFLVHLYSCSHNRMLLSSQHTLQVIHFVCSTFFPLHFNFLSRFVSILAHSEYTISTQNQKYCRELYCLPRRIAKYLILQNKSCM